MYLLNKIGGSSFGYVTNLALFPDAELVVAHLTNADLTALPRYVPFHVVDELLGLRKTHDWLNVNAVAKTELNFAVQEDMIRGTFPKRVLNKPPVHELVEYTGEYDHPGFGTATVRLEGSQLHMTVAAFKGVLAHYHFDSFTTVFQHPGLKMGQLVTFSTGDDGKVSEATFAVFGDVAHSFEKKKRAKPEFEPVITQQHFSSRHQQTVMKA
jgi:hypothetical protein